MHFSSGSNEATLSPAARKKQGTFASVALGFLVAERVLEPSTAAHCHLKHERVVTIVTLN